MLHFIKPITIFYILKNTLYKARMLVPQPRMGQHFHIIIFNVIHNRKSAVVNVTKRDMFEHQKVLLPFGNIASETGFKSGRIVDHLTYFLKL